MLRLPLGPLAALLIAGTGLTVAAQSAAPTPAPDSVPPSYPEAARAAGIEGPVRYRARVAADGTVASVEILSVPKPGYGFEDEVRRAVGAWRFDPATSSGRPVDGTYDSSVQLVPVLMGEFVIEAPPADVWRALQALAREHRLNIARVNQARQVLVTKRLKYDEGVFPKADLLGLSGGVRVKEIEWHFAVAPGFTHARVAIGVVTTLERSTDRQVFTRYNDPVLTYWWLWRLSERVGRPSEPLSTSPTRRAQQAPPLPADGEPDRCPTSSGPPVNLQRPPAGKVTRPSVASRVDAFYPARSLRDRIQSVVRLSGVVTEHGTLSDLHYETADNPEDLLTVAGATASLWRFSPAQVNGCAVQSLVTLQITFEVRSYDVVH